MTYDSPGEMSAKAIQLFHLPDAVAKPRSNQIGNHCSNCAKPYFLLIQNNDKWLCTDCDNEQAIQKLASDEPQVPEL